MAVTLEPKRCRLLKPLRGLTSQAGLLGLPVDPTGITVGHGVQAPAADGVSVRAQDGHPTGSGRVPGLGSVQGRVRAAGMDSDLEVVELTVEDMAMEVEMETLVAAALVGPVVLVGEVVVQATIARTLHGRLKTEITTVKA